MKKLLLILFILSVTMGLVYSAGLSVILPSAGTYHKGDNVTISWTPSACSSSNYKINIFRNTTDPANFVEQLLANGVTSKSWPIPLEYSNGTYIIRVKADDNSCFGDSAAFQITNPSSPEPGPDPTIKITEPSGRDLALYSRMKILWRPKNLTNNVKISLIKNGELFGIIEEGLAPGRISTEWNVGQTLIKTAIADSGFKIRIEETGVANVSAESATFSIVEEKKIDLSCYVSGHSSRDRVRVVRLTVKVRINNFGGPPIDRVPVRVNVRRQGDDPGSGDTKTIDLRNVTYKGHSYEYSLNFDFRLHNGDWTDARRSLDRIATIVVDPDDTLRDRRRMNNTSTYTFNF